MTQMNANFVNVLLIVEFELPCTEDVPTCVDTCGKMLECGEHECTQRCHTGPCGTVSLLPYHAIISHLFAYYQKEHIILQIFPCCCNYEAI